MVVQSGNEAVANANRYKTNTPGMCLMYTRTWLEIPGGTYDAITAWRNAKHKHEQGKAGDAQRPPRGAPVFWSGGSAGHGHIALAVNNSNGRSTDTFSSGKVSTADGDYWRTRWGLKYLGWTEDLNGVDIPYLRNGGADQWASGPVLVAKLHAGQKDSDSVARLRYVLLRHKDIPKASDPAPTGDDYGSKMVRAAAYWQAKVRPNLAGPKDGKSWSNAQAEAIFGRAYQVVKK